MADYTGMSMEQLNALAVAEAPNASVVQNAAKLWADIPPALVNVHDAVRVGGDQVGGCWQDRTHETAFRAPVEECLASIKNSEQTITQARPSEQLQVLGEQIGTTSQQVPQLYQAYKELEQLATAAPMLAAALQQIMEQLRMQAANLMNGLGQTYTTATAAVQAAAQGHSWKGPQAGAPPSVTADSGTPGSAQYATASTGSATGPSASSSASVTGPGEVAASASPDGSVGSGGAAGSSDTGLAGGAATAPAPPATGTVPPAGGVTAPPPATTGTAPIGVPVAGAGVGAGAAARVLPVAASGLAARSQPAPIPQAAKLPNGITSASSGQPPAMTEPATGSTASKGTRGTAPAFPIGAGVPAALSPLAMSNLQGLIRRLKPIVTQHGGPVAERPASIPGVPQGLRGRTARTDDDTGFPVQPNVRRHRHSGGRDGAPETVQLLDEEIWQVEQANASTEKVPAHR